MNDDDPEPRVISVEQSADRHFKTLNKFTDLLRERGLDDDQIEDYRLAAIDRRNLRVMLRDERWSAWYGRQRWQMFARKHGVVD